MGMELTRRGFLRAAAGGTATVLAARLPSAGAQAADDGPFRHGVASGDPGADRVVLWTRLTTTDASVEVVWDVARDQAFSDIVARGGARAEPGNDHTVHVDAGDLEAGTDHWYRFHALGATSPVGRARTLPAPGAALDSLRLGLVTCAEYEFGYFGAYRHLAERDDVDLVLHLGDYIYEFGVGYGSPPTVLPTPGPSIGRTHEPPVECTTLADYRMRYAQYRADADTQALHAAHPLIVMYDDHEVANDTWRDGAQNHQPESEGAFAERARAARQAWREWMPIRVSGADPEQVHRSFRLGDLAELWMLDERRYRDVQPANAFFSYGSVDPAIDDPARTMLGVEQRTWLLDGMAASPAAWRLMGNPVPFFPLVLAPALLDVLGSALGSEVSALPPLPPPLTVDDWNGYAAERRTIVDAVAAGPIPDVLVLTGDYHETFVSEIPRSLAQYPLDAASVAVEFVTPSVTSPGLPETLERAGIAAPDLVDAAFEANLTVNNPWIRHHEGRSNGFGVLELTAERAQFDVLFIADRLDPATPASVATSWEVLRGSSKVAPAAGPLAARGRG
ncbi:MAG: alkaline phosphatase D family protein, partial [Acidimicrobiia bacterium]|nr:alkaline phosphatase D family protein [Acidimicrobiia bacterium]